MAKKDTKNATSGDVSGTSVQTGDVTASGGEINVGINHGTVVKEVSGPLCIGGTQINR
jgi:hypothetical protein